MRSLATRDRRTSLPLLLLGTVLIGFGNASNQLSRYIAADLGHRTAAHRRSGSSCGARRSAPSSARTSSAPAGELAVALGLPELSGAYLVPIVFVGRGGGPVVRAAPTRPVRAGRRLVAATTGGAGNGSTGVRRERPRAPERPGGDRRARRRAGRDGADHDDDPAAHGRPRPRPAAVGVVISGHTFGMYGLSPISGRLTDRFGQRAGDPGRPRDRGDRRDPRGGRAARRRRAPVRRAVPARVRLEPGLRGGLGAADDRPVARRADPRPGPDRRPDLELRGGRQPRLRARRGVRRVRGPRAARRGAGGRAVPRSSWPAVDCPA